jgi:hypothetical protein
MVFWAEERGIASHVLTDINSIIESENINLTYDLIKFIIITSSIGPGLIEIITVSPCPCLLFCTFQLSKQHSVLVGQAQELLLAAV